MDLKFPFKHLIWKSGTSRWPLTIMELWEQKQPVFSPKVTHPFVILCLLLNGTSRYNSWALVSHPVWGSQLPAYLNAMCADNQQESALQKPAGNPRPPPPAPREDHMGKMEPRMTGQWRLLPQRRVSRLSTWLPSCLAHTPKLVGAQVGNHDAFSH